MDEHVNLVDPCSPVEAYIRPIRSVLFIDDQFPTFADSHQAADANRPRFAEADRARALWQACIQRGWLCDIDNSTDWGSPERQRRLAACDLLVLDLHLVGQDNRPALAIVQNLARSEMPNLVVIYTADPKPDEALMAAAASARGVSKEALEADMDPEVEELEIGWTKEDILSFLEGSSRWKRVYFSSSKTAGLHADESIGKVLLERWIASNLGAPIVDSVVPIDRIRCSESRWFQCGNLFVVMIPKPKQIAEEEARIVLDGLETAIKEWAPPWLACLVASSRRSIETGSFRDDVDLPPEPLQAGLLRYIRATDEVEERRRRAREVTSHMLSRRFARATDLMSDQLLRRTGMDFSSVPQAEGGDDQTQLLHLNAFLCSEPFSRHHLRIGSIFRADSTYWVCVTPACDMVPRDRSRSIDPWGADLDPVRPMLALRLDIRRKPTEPLNQAEQGRFLFFWDTETQKNNPIIAACFNTKTGDPNPQLEQMFVGNRARVKDGNVRVQRCVRGEDGESVTTETLECVVVSQLRAPYAERLTHIVGHHLSRIGVNFLRLPGGESEEQS